MFFKKILLISSVFYLQLDLATLECGTLAGEQLVLLKKVYYPLIPLISRISEWGKYTMKLPDSIQYELKQLFGQDYKFSFDTVEDGSLKITALASHYQYIILLHYIGLQFLLKVTPHAWEPPIQINSDGRRYEIPPMIHRLIEDSMRIRITEYRLINDDEDKYTWCLSIDNTIRSYPQVDLQITGMEIERLAKVKIVSRGAGIILDFGLYELDMSFSQRAPQYLHDFAIEVALGSEVTIPMHDLGGALRHIPHDLYLNRFTIGECHFGKVPQGCDIYAHIIPPVLPPCGTVDMQDTFGYIAFNKKYWILYPENWKKMEYYPVSGGPKQGGVVKAPLRELLEKLISGAVNIEFVGLSWNPRPSRFEQPMQLPESICNMLNLSSEI